MEGKMKRFCYILSGVIAFVLLFVFSAPSVGAFSLSTEVTIVESSNGIANWAPNGTSFLTGLQDIPNDVSYITLRYRHGGVVVARQLNDYVSVTYDLLSNGVCASTDMVEWFSGNSTYSLVTAEITGQQSYNGNYCMTSVHVVYHVDKYSSGDLNVPVSIHRNTQYLHQMMVTGFAIYRPTATASSQNQTAILNAIRDQTAQDLLYYKTIDASINRIEAILKKGISVDIDTSGLATSQGQQQTTDAVNKVDQTIKEQQEKEDKQREEDEKKAQDTSNESQSSADDAQSEVDEKSASLFAVINSVKDVILKGSDTGTCTISGDFGFFDVGSINLCAGGSKVKSITNVVGSIMLLFFTFNSALVLINRFKELYCDYMGYR